jgi:hypothetical protein
MGLTRHRHTDDSPETTVLLRGGGNFLQGYLESNRSVHRADGSAIGVSHTLKLDSLRIRLPRLQQDLAFQIDHLHKSNFTVDFYSRMRYLFLILGFLFVGIWLVAWRALHVASAAVDIFSRWG